MTTRTNILTDPRTRRGPDSAGRDSERIIKSGKSIGFGGLSTAGGAPNLTMERDENYALISVLYHALQGAETAAQYIQDARRSGQDELVKFFQDCQRIDIERSARARRLLAQRLSAGLEDDEDLEEEDLDDEDLEEDDDDDIEDELEDDEVV